jgi:thymidylate synthase
MSSAENRPESAYWDLVRRVLLDGEWGENRSGVRARSVFGATLRWDLSGGEIPLLQSRAVWWKGVSEELFWFLRGSTDAKALAARGVKIWDANGSRGFLDGRGLTERREGDLGPVYGFQWRHYGAEYKDCETDYAGLGVDQLQGVLDALKTDPTSRRMLVTAWNPTQLAEMALPPCHVLMQFSVRPSGVLSLATYQRSADLALGVPFNMASYALLLRLVCATSGYAPGELVMNFGDVHVYEPHVGALGEVLEEALAPGPGFPQLEVATRRERLEDYSAEDVRLTGYAPKRVVRMKMVV